MNHSQEPLALLIFFALCGLAILGFVFFFKLDFAAKRTAARSALPFLLFSVAGVFGLLWLADGLRVAHVATPPDGDSWLLILALLFAFLGGAIARRNRRLRPRKARR